MCNVQVPLLSPQECEAQPGSSLPHHDQVSVQVTSVISVIIIILRSALASATQ